MSRYHPTKDTSEVFNAVTYWRNTAFESQGSIFVPSPVWSDDSVASLDRYFVQNLDTGTDSFMIKLERQLEHAPPAAKQLAAEMLWFMLLCPSNISPNSKRETIQTVWSWSSAPSIQESRWLRDEVLVGIGSAGTAFNTLRWKELRFFVEFVKAFRQQPLDTRQSQLNDAWQFAAWLNSVHDSDVRQLRHMLVYLLFPEHFERIFGGVDRRKIVKGFSGLTNQQIASLSPIDIDRELKSIRAEQEKKLPESQLDFYELPLVDLWSRDEVAADNTAVDVESEISRIGRSLQKEHVLKAINEIDSEGIPHEGRSVTYDLMHHSRRYPPKLVFSLAAKFATGVLLPRNHFVGGEDSPAFKYLRDLGFPIERKDFLPA